MAGEQFVRLALFGRHLSQIFAKRLQCKNIAGAPNRLDVTRITMASLYGPDAPVGPLTVMSNSLLFQSLWREAMHGIN
jgi:hypothetical protein